MSNIYLEKIASIYDYWKDVSGKDHHDLKARKAHLEKALANGDTPESLAKKIGTSGRKMFRARAQGLAGLTIIGASAAIAGNKYANHQNEVAADNIKQMMMLKSAAIDVKKFWGTVKSTRKPIAASGRAVFRTGNVVFKSGVNAINTAHGGKVREFALKEFGEHSKLTKNFTSGSKKTQMRQAYKNAAKKGGDKAAKKDAGRKAVNELRSLHEKQRNAKVGVYGSVGAVAYAHNKGKKEGRIDATQRMYY